MNRRIHISRCTAFQRWLEFCTSTALMGLSALIAMLALEYLVTGTFGAAREYFGIALFITLGLVIMHWRRYRMRPQRHELKHPFPPRA